MKDKLEQSMNFCMCAVQVLFNTLFFPVRCNWKQNFSCKSCHMLLLATHFSKITKE